MNDDALVVLTKLATESSPRYAIQLITVSNLAISRKRQAIEVMRFVEVLKTFKGQVSTSPLLIRSGLTTSTKPARCS